MKLVIPSFMFGFDKKAGCIEGRENISCDVKYARIVLRSQKEKSGCQRFYFITEIYSR